MPAHSLGIPAKMSDIRSQIFWSTIKLRGTCAGVFLPAKLDANLFGNCQRIIHIDAKVPNGALDLPVTKKKLDGA
jgi:hypothetical protein